MRDGAAALQDGLGAARTEVTRHDTQSAQLTTNAALRDETTRHVQAMQAIMAPMRQTLDGMSHCQRGGTMMSMMDNLDSTIGSHTTTMGQATDVAEAHQDCQNYVASMRGLMDRMAPFADDMGCGM